MQPQEQSAPRSLSGRLPHGSKSVGKHLTIFHRSRCLQNVGSVKHSAHFRDVAVLSLAAKQMKSFARSNAKTRIEKSNSIDPIGVVVTAL